MSLDTLTQRDVHSGTVGPGNNDVKLRPIGRRVAAYGMDIDTIVTRPSLERLNESYAG